jgi:CMP-N-acetylneuraminic acid synthetase
MNVCIIPARGGSKRLPKKNLLEFRGKPLVQISLETAVLSNYFDRVILSSDDEEILKIGSLVRKVELLNRSESFSGDSVRADEVVRMIANELNLGEHDLICCLLPTTPLLTSNVLKAALESYRGEGALFGVCKTVQTPFRTFTKSADGVLSSIFPEMLLKQSNDYPVTYTDAGQFYIAAKKVWDSNFSITATPEAIGFELPYELSIDINTQIDWEILQRLHP